MGTDYVVNVGPVAFIKNPPVPTTETHNCCNNKDCKEFHSRAFDKFCPNCGNQIGEWIEPVMKPLNIDFYELLKERLVPSSCQNSADEIIILVPNTYRKDSEAKAKAIGFESFNLKYGEECRIFPTPEKMKSYVEEFEKEFSDELIKLKEVFGQDNVSVRYGTIGEVC